MRLITVFHVSTDFNFSSTMSSATTVPFGVVSSGLISSRNLEAPRVTWVASSGSSALYAFCFDAARSLRLSFYAAASICFAMDRRKWNDWSSISSERQTNRNELNVDAYAQHHSIIPLLNRLHRRSQRSEVSWRKCFLVLETWDIWMCGRPRLNWRLSQRSVAMLNFVNNCYWKMI